MAKKEEELTKKERSFRHELFEQMLTLSTSGFGLVAALAWNEAIQAFVKNYIQYFFPSQSDVIAKFLYAFLITIFAVFVTYQLSRLSARFSTKK